MATMKFLKNWTIDINKLPKYTSFQTKYDIDVDYKILKMMYDSDMEVFTSDRKQLLLPLLNKIKNDKLKIQHSNRHGLGRFYANESISPICVSRHIKHTLFKYQGWIDFDMIKGHPTILYEIALKNNIILKSFKNYLENNETIFNTLIKYYFGKIKNLDDFTIKRDHIKDIFNRMIYGGSFKSWVDQMKENNIKLVTTEIHNIISEFKLDCKFVIDLIYDNNEEITMKVKQDTVEEYKLKNRVMSYYCQTIENEILSICYKHLVSNSLIENKNICLEYDGVCFKPQNILNVESVIHDINQNILKKTGLNVRMGHKEYSNLFVNSRIIEERNSYSEQITIQKASPIEYPQVDCFSEEMNELVNSNINQFIFNSTDVDLAKFFNLVYGKNHKCCSIKEKLWYNFNQNQNIWEVDNRIEVRHKISNDFYLLYDAYNTKLCESYESMDKCDRKCESYQKLIKKINELKTTLRTTNDKNNILRELQEELFDGSFLEDMNKETYMLPIKNNKILNMKTLEVTERTFENKFNFICDAEYIDLNEEQESDIKKYFMDLFVNNENVMKCVLNIIKSSFTGVLLRYIFFHTGSGSNGKSLLFKIMSNIFSNIMNVINKDVILEKKSSSHINTEFEKLETCRLAYVSELKETDVLNVTNIKAISGGDDINLRGICKTDRTITPVSTLHVLTNKLPKFDVEKAMVNRIVMIPYKAEFKIDKSFEGEMLGKKSEIFSFIMKYGNIVDNLDDIPEEMTAMKNQYTDDNAKDDYLQDFINDKIIYDEHERVLRDEFRERYNNHCSKCKNPIDTSTNTKFTRILKEKYNIDSHKSNGKVYYIGIEFEKY
jgi:hypothetical protein